MATWQWSYPYDDTDTATVVFNASPASAIYRWRGPNRDNPVPRQSVVRHVDGSTRAYTIGTAGRVFVCRFVNLPEGSAETATEMYGKLGIEEFLETHTEFGRRTFGFWDHAGTSEIEVRYDGGFEDWQQERGGRWSGNIRFYM